jgi:hypothetical protein
MENNNQASSKVLGGVGRYVLGLILLLLPLAILFIKGKPFNYIFLAVLVPPLNLVILPPIAIGLYFMLSGKYRIRIDITLLLFYILFIFGILSF